jgi:hypothetical protein
MVEPEPPIAESPYWLPSPQQVADLLRARTKDDNSTELGTWTANTRPTEYEVEGLIQTAAGDLLAAVDLLYPEYEDPDGAAGSLCTYRAAMLVELSYWPEQVQAQQSAYAEYRTAWQDGVKALNKKLAGPPAGGSTYSVQTRTSTLQEVYSGALGYLAPAYADQAFMGVVNLPELETTLPILPTDPIEVPFGPTPEEDP